MVIVKNLVDKTKYGIKCPYEMTPEFIVIHNTANDASARNEISYMRRNDKQVSFHYAIDDKEIVQGILENRNAWHAGDSNGEGNRKGIAIEICYSKSGGTKFINAEKRTAKFVAEKLKEYGWGIDRVKKHQDFSGKYCPHRTLDMGWSRFLTMIEKELSGVPEVSVKEWQKAAIADGFTFPTYGADGKWGKECETVAKNAICKYRFLNYKYKNLVKIIQKVVGVKADGKFGTGTKKAVIEYQKSNGLVADGIVGLNTWKKILGV